MKVRRWMFPVIGVGMAAAAVSVANGLDVPGFGSDSDGRGEPFAQTDDDYEISVAHEAPSLDSLPTEVASSLARSDYAASPRALRPDECTAARPRMEGIAQLAASRVEQLDLDSERERLETALKESRAWFDAGCPPHERLGIYPANDGSGTMNILIDF
ncbi:MAG: hypothetical protein ACREF4_20825 [Gammaproteobacteria bacterium]